MAQLAEMGVSIPDEFRPDMAMAGEWQVTEERIIGEDEEKPLDAKASGVRKRAVEEEDEEAAEANKRRWGSAYRSHPTKEEDEDLDTLLGNVTGIGKALATKLEAKVNIKVKVEEELDLSNLPTAPESSTEPDISKVEIKTESSEDLPTDTSAPSLEVVVKEEVEMKELEVVFKKRKAKNIRQR